MPLVSLIENLNVFFKCVFPSKIERVKKSIRENTRDIPSIVILQIKDTVDIENLFPITNHVALWNSFVVGKNKEYILVSVNDELKELIIRDKLLNNTGENILPKDLNDFFEYLWRTTIYDSINLQLYMLYQDSVYLVNTYSLKNAKNNVIGAVGFMRKVKNMPNTPKPEIRISADISQLVKRNETIKRQNTD